MSWINVKNPVYWGLLMVINFITTVTNIIDVAKNDASVFPLILTGTMFMFMLIMFVLITCLRFVRND